MTDRDAVEEIRVKADIVDLISESVSLKRSGSGFKGLCPFHAEKTPSFTVSPERQTFHCFGCGAGGDIFSFVQRRDGLSFPEALEHLGERYGVEIPRQRGPQRSGNRHLEILSASAEWFRSNLKGAPAEYLRARGVDDGTAERFGLGAAPEGWSGLVAHLAKKGFSQDEIVAAGMAARSRGGRVYDTFRNRVVFPIRDLQGRVLGFGGRALGDGTPKYLNSPETKWFKKGRLLYGLKEARDAIRKDGRGILVEGYMDVIACHRHGIENAVAALGTALTEGHAALLRRFADGITLVFDADPAGVKAAFRALPILLEQDLDVQVLTLPGNDDPDTFLAREGAESFLRFAEAESRSIVDFLLDAAVQRGSGTQRARKALEVVLRIPSPLVQATAIRSLADRLDVREHFLVEELDRLRRRTKTPRADSREKTDKAGPAPITPKEELYVLAAALRRPDLAERLVAGLEPTAFLSPPVQTVFGKLKRLVTENRTLTFSSFAAEGLGEHESRVLSEAFALDAIEEATEAIFTDCVEKIRGRHIRTRIDELRQRIRNGDRRAMKEYLELERVKNSSSGEGK